jgi:hypothetical protein
MVSPDDRDVAVVRPCATDRSDIEPAGAGTDVTSLLQRASGGVFAESASNAKSRWMRRISAQTRSSGGGPV